jgi:molybdopterin converting factor small subunit
VANVRYFAAARAAAGVAEENIPATTLAEALTRARQGRDDRFGAVLGLCTFLVDGVPVGTRHHDAVPVSAESVVDCLPPFAGG